MFTVASGRHEVNYDQKCLNWFAGEMNWLWLVRFYLSWTLPCPCDIQLVAMDSRWRFDWSLYYKTDYETRCFYERIPSWYSSQVSPFIIRYIVCYKTSCNKTTMIRIRAIIDDVNIDNSYSFC